MSDIRVIVRPSPIRVRHVLGVASNVDQVARDAAEAAQADATSALGLLADLDATYASDAQVAAVASALSDLSDHVDVVEAEIPAPAVGVVGELSFGQAAVVGVATGYAREDHSHGTPDRPSYTAADVGADPAGTADAAIADHVADLDPHPGYLTQAEADGLYDSLGAAAALPAAALDAGEVAGLDGIGLGIDNPALTADDVGSQVEGWSAVLDGVAGVTSGTGWLHRSGASGAGTWTISTPSASDVGALTQSAADALYDAIGAAAAVTTTSIGAVPTSRTISTTSPLTGGGDLSANRTLGITVGSGGVQSWDADLDALAALSGTGGWAKRTASNTWTISTPTSSDVGLGNVENTALSTWAGSTSLVTLGTVTTGTWSGTAIAVAKGGTGSTTASDARTALGLAIGTNVQAWDADLDGLAGLSTNGVAARTSGTWGITSAGATGLSLLAASTAAGARSTLSLVPGTDVQAYDADLDALAGLSSNGFIARSGSGTAVVRTITAGTGIAVTNGDGGSGAPTIARAANTDASLDWVDLFEAGDQSESANSATNYGTLVTFTPTAGKWYAVEYWMVHSTAVNSTGYQHGIFQSATNQAEAVLLTSPLSGSTQVIDQNNGFNNVIAATTSVASSVKALAVGRTIFQAHATTPTAITLKFRSEVNGSAVTTHAAWMRYRRLN